MDRALRVGLVGFGAVGRLHCEAYRGLPDIDVVAVTDSDPVRAAVASQEYSLRAYPSLDDMLSNVSLDIACILTPPAVHEDLVLRCAAGGLHVLCEKPLAVSVEACHRMIAACRSGGVRLCYGASYRYLPALTIAREMIQRGALGQIMILREHAIGGRGPEHRDTLGHSHYPRGGPGGSGMGLCDHGIHLIDTFSWLMDSPVVNARGRGNITGELQGTEFAHLEYANGAIGQLLYEDGTYSTDMPQEGVFAWAGGWNVGEDAAVACQGGWQSHPGSIHLHGSRGSLRIFHYANKLFHRDDSGVHEVRVPDHPFPANFSLQLNAFARSIREGTQTPVPGEVGLEAWRVVQSIYAGRGALARIFAAPAET
jgi:predicted dehydrogenase